VSITGTSRLKGCMDIQSFMFVAHCVGSSLQVEQAVHIVARRLMSVMFVGPCIVVITED